MWHAIHQNITKCILTQSVAGHRTKANKFSQQHSLLSNNHHHSIRNIHFYSSVQFGDTLSNWTKRNVWRNGTHGMRVATLDECISKWMRKKVISLAPVQKETLKRYYYHIVSHGLSLRGVHKCCLFFNKTERLAAVWLSLPKWLVVSKCTDLIIVVVVVHVSFL